MRSLGGKRNTCARYFSLAHDSVFGLVMIDYMATSALHISQVKNTCLDGFISLKKLIQHVEIIDPSPS